eukprot:5275402-Pyramimonas_sp.AAC.1
MRWKVSELWLWETMISVLSLVCLSSVPVDLPFLCLQNPKGGPFSPQLLTRVVEHAVAAPHYVVHRQTHDATKPIIVS